MSQNLLSLKKKLLAYFLSKTNRKCIMLCGQFRFQLEYRFDLFCIGSNRFLPARSNTCVTSFYNVTRPNIFCIVCMFPSTVPFLFPFFHNQLRLLLRCFLTNFVLDLFLERGVLIFGTLVSKLPRKVMVVVQSVIGFFHGVQSFRNASNENVPGNFRRHPNASPEAQQFDRQDIAKSFGRFQDLNLFAK